MPKRDDLVPLRHMLDYAREAVAMIAGRKPGTAGRTTAIARKYYTLLQKYS